MKNITISTISNVPIYQQLYDQIATQIINGDLVPNTQLPSIRTSAKELRISIITVKKAFEDLERDGYIQTIAGKGSFVSKLSNISIEKKKIEFMTDMLEDKLKYFKDLGMTKEMIYELLEKLYKNKS